jgi:hypothetical protein
MVKARSTLAAAQLLELRGAWSSLRKAASGLFSSSLSPLAGSRQRGGFFFARRSSRLAGGSPASAPGLVHARAFGCDVGSVDALSLASFFCGISSNTSSMSSPPSAATRVRLLMLGVDRLDRGADFLQRIDPRPAPRLPVHARVLVEPLGGERQLAGQHLHAAASRRRAAGAGARRRTPGCPSTRRARRARRCARSSSSRPRGRSRGCGTRRRGRRRRRAGMALMNGSTAASGYFGFQPALNL